VSGAARFSRAPRRPVPILKSERYDTLHRVQADPRFRARKPSTRNSLVVAITTVMDGEGKWWWKVREWAHAVGCSMSTVKRAIAELERAGLIRTVKYMRPDGFQGSTTYWLDPLLVARLPDLNGAAPSREPPCDEPPPVTNNRSSLQASLGEEPLFDSGGSQVAHLVDATTNGRNGQAGSPLTHLVDALFQDDHPTAYRDDT
jgi:hypothetical protein